MTRSRKARYMAKSDVDISSALVVDLAEEELIQVLHVDDEPSLLKAAKQILEMQGNFRVETALSVEEAMEKMKQEPYDVIVCDYEMPERDGLDFLRELRHSGNTIPFIIFTGKGREEVAVEALNLGADGYFKKFGGAEAVCSELAHGIRQVVERKEAEKKLRESKKKFRNSYESIPDARAIMLKGFEVQDFVGRI